MADADVDSGADAAAPLEPGVELLAGDAAAAADRLETLAVSARSRCQTEIFF